MTRIDQQIESPIAFDPPILNSSMKKTKEKIGSVEIINNKKRPGTLCIL
ncbi:MAG TPA: hypothetical protein VFI70_03365 [Nitrososphaeraceae archaeon]|nr:hypothetical protein [Nitrososphaeraceae archaeon]